MKVMLQCLILCLCLGWQAANADEEAGHQIFKSRCGICHSDESGRNRIGPSLFNVVGRPAGSVDGYSYSEANRQSGIVWTQPNLDRYLTGPQVMVPGTKMTFPGLPDAQQRADVIAYLVSISPARVAQQSN